MFLKNKKPSGKFIIITSVIVLIAGLGAFYLSDRGKFGFLVKDKPDTSKLPTTPTTDSKINFDPPTQAEKAASDQHKQNLSNPQTPPSNSSGKQEIAPVIANIRQVNTDTIVGAFVPNIFESDGICIFTISQGSKAITKQSRGMPDATTTRCENITVARSEFTTTGTWSVITSYNSVKSTGQSKPQYFEVK